MKSWFTKLRISTAIDSGRSMPASLQKRIAASEELKRFCHDVEHLEHALRETPSPMRGAPPNLHGAIMSAVRKEATHSANRTISPILRWLPAPALAALLIWAIVHFTSTGSDSRSEMFVSTISSLNDEMELAQTTPQDVMAPLTEELKRLNHDVEEARSFLLASLP